MSLQPYLQFSPMRYAPLLPSPFYIQGNWGSPEVCPRSGYRCVWPPALPCWPQAPRRWRCCSLESMGASSFYISRLAARLLSIHSCVEEHPCEWTTGGQHACFLGMNAQVWTAGWKGKPLAKLAPSGRTVSFTLPLAVWKLSAFMTPPAFQNHSQEWFSILAPYWCAIWWSWPRRIALSSMLEHRLLESRDHNLLTFMTLWAPGVGAGICTGERSCP